MVTLSAARTCAVGCNASSPDAPPPSQMTCQTLVAVIVTPLATAVQTCPQSGEAAPALLRSNGVPGPLHVTVVPSPMSQTTRCRTAVAVTVTPPAEAVAEVGPLEAGPGSIHIHSGKPTVAPSLPGGREVRIGGASSASSL